MQANRVFKGRIILLVSLVVVLFLLFRGNESILPWSSNFDLPVLARRSRPAVMLIVTSDSQGETGTGTGFFVSSGGILVTNRHVIVMGTKAIVKDEEGRSFPVVGVLADDQIEDLVLLKVEGTGFPFLEVGNSNSTDLRIGERVAVIGSPLGLQGSVSDGVVSAFRQDNYNSRLIQITAAISPGSSGSPVLNGRGEVVGVATLLLQGGQSLNFAIPSSALKLLSATAARSSATPLAQFVTARRTTAPTRDKDYDAYRSAYEIRDWQASVVALLSFIARNPTSARGYSDLGFVYVQLGRYKDALKATKKAIELGCNDANDWGTLGDIYMELQQLSDAEAAFKHEIEVDPQGVLAAHAWENLYSIYKAQQQSSEASSARAHLQEAIKHKAPKRGF